MPSFLLALLAVGQVAAGGDSQKHMDALKTYVGKDLKDLNEKDASELDDLLDAMLPAHAKRYSNGDLIPRDFRRGPGYIPWHVWHFKKNGESYYVLFEANTSRPHPGSTWIRNTLLSPSGKMLSDSEFSTGHREYMQGVELNSLIDGEYPIIVFKMSRVPFPKIPKQYYAKLGNRFDLIRLEDNEGKAMRNEYYVSHFQSGPNVPLQTEEAWEADLLGNDRLKVLRALVWLGGVHWNKPEERTVDKQGESAQFFKLVRKVRARPKVQARLKQLAAGKNVWEREAAVLALHPKDDSFD